MTIPLVIGIAIALQAQKLNGPLPSDPGLGGGDVSSFVLDSSETRFAYCADQEVAGRIELYAGPLDQSTIPVRVNGALVANGDVRTGTPRFSPDGAWLVYLADAELDEREELYSVPADGSGQARKLNGMLVAGGEILEGTPILVSPDSSRVVYCADHVFDERFELWSAPIDGGASAVLVSGSMQEHGDVASSYRISPDSALVAFIADREVDGRADLYVSPLDGSQPPLRLNPPFNLERGIVGERGPGFLFTADGARIVYRADQLTDLYTLFSVPVDGSAPPTELTIPGTNRDVVEFALTSTGRVVFTGDLRADNGFELFSAPDDLSATNVRLSGTFVAGGDVVSAGSGPSLALESDGVNVVFSADKLVNGHVELFRVPVLGGAEPVPLGGSPRSDGRVTSFGFDREETHVVFVADGFLFADELYASSLASPAPHRLSPALVQGGNVSADFRAASGRVLFRADAEVNERFELWGAPLVGWPGHARTSDGGTVLSRGPVRLHAPLAAASDIGYGAFALTSADRALWRGDHATTGQYELISRRADSSGSLVTLNGALTDGPPRGSVQKFAALDGHVVYSGGQLTAQGDGVFRVTPASAPAYEVLAELPALHAVREFQQTSDGERLFVLAAFAVRQQYELYVLPSDGIGQPVRVSPAPSSSAGVVSDGFQLTGDGAHVLFSGNLLSAGLELFSAPVDLSAPALRLHGDLTAERRVTDFQPTADGLRAVFRADLGLDEHFELYSATLDGSTGPVPLSGTMLADADAGPFVLSPDGGFAYFVADAVTDGLFELWRAPTNGSEPPERLSVPAQGSVHFSLWITPDGSRLLYKTQLGEIADLFSVLSDGSAAPILLHPGHTSSGKVEEVVLVEGGTAVAYVELEEGTRDPGIFRTPVDGSGVPFALTPRQASNQDRIEALRASPDGTRLLYFVRPIGIQSDELRLVAVDGGSAPTVLRATTGFPEFAFSPDGGHVIARTATTLNGALELYVAPSDGSALLVRINDALVQGGNVTGFAFGPGPTDLLYRADQEQDELFELYRVDLP